MRCAGTLPGLASPFPLGEHLPGLYRDDAFTQRFTAAFDEVLAGAVQVLDCFPAYLDPALAPEDFLEWLGSWVGATPDETWPIERRRAFVASAVELFRIRGTAAGLAAHVAVFTGGEVEIAEPGATAWSREAGAADPGRRRRRTCSSGSGSRIRSPSPRRASTRWSPPRSPPTSRTGSRSSKA